MESRSSARKQPAKAKAKARAKPKAETKAKPKAKPKPSANAKPKADSKVKPPKLLSGGNPQIAKADGDAPVQAYIAAMPGWKSDVGRWLDALIVRSVPQVQKAVKWNSPLYGLEGKGWFLGIHTFTKYVKVAFFRGASLRRRRPARARTRPRATSTSAKASRSTRRSS